MLELLAQKRDVSLHVVVACAGCHSPSLLNERILRHDDLRLAHEDLQDGEFLEAKLERFVSTGKLVVLKTQMQIAYSQAFELDFALAAGKRT